MRRWVLLLLPPLLRQLQTQGPDRLRDVRPMVRTRNQHVEKVMLSKKLNLWLICSMLLLLAIPNAALAQKEASQKDKDKKPTVEYTGTPVFWTDPTDIQSRNLLLGAGGESMKPNLTKVTFIEQKTG